MFTIVRFPEGDCLKKIVTKTKIKNNYVIALSPIDWRFFLVAVNMLMKILCRCIRISRCEIRVSNVRNTLIENI